MNMLRARGEGVGTGGCPIPDHLSGDGGGPFVGNFTFYQINMIFSGACTVVVLFVTLGLMARHAMRMSNPAEQLKIMRVVNMIPSYQLLCFLSICFPDAYLYIQGFTEVFQGIALYAFLMLLCDFMAPTDQDKVEFFSSLETKRQWQPKKKRNGLAFLSLSWWCVLQYPIITWVAAIAQVVTQLLRVFCLESNEVHFAHVWITVVTSLSTSVAVNAILQFYTKMKGYMKEHHPLTKLVAFKLIVGLVWIEKIIFLILTGTQTIIPGQQLTVNDVLIGFPNLIICFQMVPISFFILYAYPTKPYAISYKSINLRPRAYQELQSDGDEEMLTTESLKRYHGGWMGLRAWCLYLSPLNLCRDVWSAHKMISTSRAVQKAHMREQTENEMMQYETSYDGVTGVA